LPIRPCSNGSAVSSRAPWTCRPFSYRVDDELVAKAYGCGLRADRWIDNHNIGLRKGALLPGINKIANSRADIIGDTCRASEIWSAPVGGDSWAGTGLSVSTNRVTSNMPPAIRTSATRVFVVARSLFIIPKNLGEVGGPHRSAAVALRSWPPVRRLPKGLKPRRRSPKKREHLRGRENSFGKHMGSKRPIIGWTRRRAGYRTSRPGYCAGICQCSERYWTGHGRSC